MDSLMGKLSFSANGGEPSKFSLEFGSGEFTPAEMKRIMTDEKLAEMALADPKRVKRYVVIHSIIAPINQSIKTANPCQSFSIDDRRLLLA